MNLEHFLQGYLIGISVGTTVGISGVLCIKNIMSGKIKLGIASVVAAAIADMSSSAIALFGLTFLQSFLMPYKTGLSIATGLLLCFIGIKRMFGTVSIDGEQVASAYVSAAFFKVFFLGLVDPVTILDFLAISFGLTLDFSILQKFYQFIAGIFLGSLTWWSSLLILVLFLKKRLSPKVFNYIQQFVGAGILFLGIWTIWLAYN